MTSELITPDDEHREEIVGLMRVAFNLGSGAMAERAAWLPVEKMRWRPRDARGHGAARGGSREGSAAERPIPGDAAPI
jgi:hypothetical protein